MFLASQIFRRIVSRAECQIDDDGAGGGGAVQADDESKEGCGSPSLEHTRTESGQVVKRWLQDSTEGPHRAQVESRTMFL